MVDECWWSFDVWCVVEFWASSLWGAISSSATVPVDLKWLIFVPKMGKLSRKRCTPNWTSFRNFGGLVNGSNYLNSPNNTNNTTYFCSQPFGPQILMRKPPPQPVQALNVGLLSKLWKIDGRSRCRTLLGVATFGVADWSIWAKSWFSSLQFLGGKKWSMGTSKSLGVLKRWVRWVDPSSQRWGGQNPKANYGRHWG